jgi:hypothetical protein
MKNGDKSCHVSFIMLTSIDKNRYMKKKDDELIKMSIGVRRDMEDKMRIERSSLKEALTTTNKRELEAAVDRSKLVSMLNL